MGATATCHEPSISVQRAADRPPETTSHASPRFPGDWVEARLRLCPGSSRVRVGTGTHDWILPARDIGALRAALAGAPEALVQFNPDAGLVLIPGAHELLGSSFFRLRG